MCDVRVGLLKELFVETHMTVGDRKYECVERYCGSSGLQNVCAYLICHIILFHRLSFANSALVVLLFTR